MVAVGQRRRADRMPRARGVPDAAARPGRAQHVPDAFAGHGGQYLRVHAGGPDSETNEKMK